VLDGSRRRAACIFSGAKFEILVTEDEISLEDARQLAKDIQTAREHTLREIGQRYQFMYANGMSKDEIARVEDVSPASVSERFKLLLCQLKWSSYSRLSMNSPLLITSCC
jgi:ParB family chromosome partitioning protein